VFGFDYFVKKMKRKNNYFAKGFKINMFVKK
jgi:hypothetical protein